MTPASPVIMPPGSLALGGGRAAIRTRCAALGGQTGQSTEDGAAAARLAVPASWPCPLPLVVEY